MATTPVSVPLLGLPIVPALRSAVRAVTDPFRGEAVRNGVLAFTESGRRVFLGRKRFRATHPTDVVRQLPGDVPVTIDRELFHRDLIPELEIGDDHFIVNGVDFRVLTKVVVNEGIDEPLLAEQVRPYHDQLVSLAQDDPNAIRSVINEQ